jgi:hypothetical protein
MKIWKEKEKMVGASGFEPPASCSRSRRASQAALRPDTATASQIKNARSPGIFRVAHGAATAKKSDFVSFRSLCFTIRQDAALRHFNKPAESRFASGRFD